MRKQERHVQTCKVKNIYFPSHCLAKLLDDVEEEGGEERGGGRKKGGGGLQTTRKMGHNTDTVKRTVNEEDKRRGSQVDSCGTTKIRVYQRLQARHHHQ